MGCLKTDTCCCCFSLRTGGLILGWLGVIGGGLGAIAYLAIDPKKLPPSPLPEAYQTTPEMDLIRNIITFIVCGLLLYGIYYQRSPFLLPQVALSVLSFFSVLVIIGLVIFGSIVAISSDDEKLKKGGYAMLGALVLFLPGLALIWHFTSVIYSLYQQIKEEQDRNPGVTYHVPAQRDPYKV